MCFWNALWADESGFVMSAEAVAVGTLGVAGIAVGAGAVANSVNAELEETAFALRSLDQSYSIPEQRIGNAFVAGSSFTQRPVKEAHQELREQIQRDRVAQEKALKEKALKEKALKEKALKEAQREAAKGEKPADPPKKKKRKKGKDGDELEAVKYVPAID